MNTKKPNYALFAEYCEWRLAGRPRYRGNWRHMRRARRQMRKLTEQFVAATHMRVQEYVNTPFVFTPVRLPYSVRLSHPFTVYITSV